MAESPYRERARKFLSQNGRYTVLDGDDRLHALTAEFDAVAKEAIAEERKHILTLIEEIRKQEASNDTGWWKLQLRP